jgi:butyryl-CoA dehydrogenase
MKDFKDKVVVITGAASGMGKAYALEFARLGARLALCDIDPVGLEEVNAQTARQVGETNVYQEVLDVSDQEAVFAFATAVQTKLGAAQVVINNAGGEGKNQPLYHIGLADFRRLIEVNFFGVVYGSKAFLPQLLSHPEAALVNVSSIFGMIGPPGAADYAASKFAVRGFTESLMAEFYRSSLTVHCLHPGGIDTNIVKHPDYQEFAKRKLTTPPEDVARYVIKCIRRKKQKIVCGNESHKVWFLANFLPKKWFLPLLFSDMKKYVKRADYRAFNPRLFGEE